MIDVVMDTRHLRRRALPMLIAVAAAILVAIVPAAGQETAPAPKQLTGVTVRGCLAGSKLTLIDSGNLPASFPATLEVRSIRVIRDQVKALNGHTVDVIGKLRGIPGQETGLLVADTGDVRLYLGGGDARLGYDLVSPRNEPPTIEAHTIKNVADTCSTGQPESSTAR
jgi:hypothetical protein